MKPKSKSKSAATPARAPASGPTPKKAAAAKAAPAKAAAPKAATKPAPAKPAKPAAARKPAKRTLVPRVPAERPSSPEVVAQMRELEAQLDKLIEEASRPDLAALDRDEELLDVDEEPAVVVAPAEPPAPAPEAPAPAEEREDREEEEEEEELPVASGPGREPPSIPYARPSGPLPAQVAPGEATVFDTARELLSTDFYLRKWGRLAMRNRSEEVDDFGYDPKYDAKLKPALDFLYTRYFRVDAKGVDHVPRQGRCLLVANHSGTVPLDGVMIKTAVLREHPAGRHVRWLTEDFIYHFPYLGGAMNRLGAVRACQENAERLLAKDELVAVFPEGIKGIGKLFAQRYRLQRFGRGGFIKLGLRTQTPIVPVAVIGAEETNPLLFRLEHLSKLVGLPYVPVTPTFPLLGPAGLLPAPTKWRMIFGEPIDFSSYGPEAADDELLVGKLAERVRATIQGMLDREVGSRKSIFFG